MLRLVVLVLVLLNGVYFAWSQGLLLGLGFAPVQTTEPQRLAQQIKPEALRVLSPQEMKKRQATPPVVAKPTECLQAGLFDTAQSEALRAALARVVPTGSWQLQDVRKPARWIVYMGKYASPEDLVKKRAQLASLNLKFELLQNPALAPGLSLGGFETQDAANKALAAFSQRGVRTARVLQERAEAQGWMLLLPAVDDAVKARLDELTPALAGKPLSACP